MRPWIERLWLDSDLRIALEALVMLEHHTAEWSVPEQIEALLRVTRQGCRAAAVEAARRLARLIPIPDPAALAAQLRTGEHGDVELAGYLLSQLGPLSPQQRQTALAWLDGPRPTSLREALRGLLERP